MFLLLIKQLIIFVFFIRTAEAANIPTIVLHFYMGGKKYFPSRTCSEVDDLLGPQDGNTFPDTDAGKIEKDSSSELYVN